MPSMKFILLGLVGVALVTLPCLLPAQTVRPFVSFSDQGNEYPESIARDQQGNLYLSLTFGQRLKKITPAGVVSDFAVINDDWLLGVTVDARGNVMVAGTNGVWKVTPAGVVTLFAEVPGHLSLNDLTYDQKGNLYVTDDTLGVIWKVDSGGNATVWCSDVRLGPTNPSFPFPVGCNGIAFSHDRKKLLTTNTSDGFLLAVDVLANGTAGTVRVIASSPRLIGADGIKVDAADNVYVAQNINRQILRVNPCGEITTVVQGGLLSFPTSLVFGSNSNTLFICNNGDAFFSDKPSGQGVLRLVLRP